MGRTDYFAPGQWNFTCDQCGFTWKSKDGRKEWDNLMVCPRCLDPRHPQELVRPIVDPKPIPWSRPFEDEFVDPVVPATPTKRLIDATLIDQLTLG